MCDVYNFTIVDTLRRRLSYKSIEFRKRETKRARRIKSHQGQDKNYLKYNTLTNYIVVVSN